MADHGRMIDAEMWTDPFADGYPLRLRRLDDGSIMGTRYTRVENLRSWLGICGQPVEIADSREPIAVRITERQIAALGLQG
jgi:hypothetical protein